MLLDAIAANLTADRAPAAVAGDAYAASAWPSAFETSKGLEIMFRAAWWNASLGYEVRARAPACARARARVRRDRAPSPASPPPPPRAQVTGANLAWMIQAQLIRGVIPSLLNVSAVDQGAAGGGAEGEADAARHHPLPCVKAVTRERARTLTHARAHTPTRAPRRPYAQASRACGRR